MQEEESGKEEVKGTQFDDAKLMDKALKEFADSARTKFLNGIKEHNPDGDRGMCKMSFEDRIKAAKEEVIDLWFYLTSIEYGRKKDS